MKTLIISSLFVLGVLLLTPAVSAVEYNAVTDTLETKLEALPGYQFKEMMEDLLIDPGDDQRLKLLIVYIIAMIYYAIVISYFKSR